MFFDLFSNFDLHIHSEKSGYPVILVTSFCRLHFFMKNAHCSVLHQDESVAEIALWDQILLRSV